MKNKTLIFIARVLIFISIVLLLCPRVSNDLYQKSYDNAIEKFDVVAEQIQEGSYQEELKKGTIDNESYPIDENGNRLSQFAVLFKEDIDRLYDDSVAYNKQLSERQTFECGFEGSPLDLTQYGIFNGVYGYISAPSIDLNLPIYLGASDNNMRYGATQMYSTSLPVGGKNTNTVLAGHTDYIGRTLFDYIPYLSHGDIVSITNYFDTIDYRVVNQKIITNSETNDIYIQKDKDLLTLLTCSNGGKDRYLVICERVN